MTDELEKRVSEIVSKARKPEAAKSILALLFPRVENAIHTYITSENRDFRQRSRFHRISNKDYAGHYFELDSERPIWSLSEIEKLLDDPEPRNAIKSLIQTIEASDPQDQKYVRRTLIESLVGAFGTQREFTTNWFLALIDSTSYFIGPENEDERTFFGETNLDRLRRAAIFALRELPEDRKCQIFLEAINAAEDLSLLSDVARTEIGDIHPQGATGHRRDNQNLGCPDQIRDALVQKIQDQVEQGKFWENSEPGRVIWFWWGSNHESEVKNFTTKEVETNKGLHTLLDITVSTVLSTGGNFERVNRDSWNKIVDLELLERKALEILKESPNHKIASRFIEALNRKDD